MLEDENGKPMSLSQFAEQVDEISGHSSRASSWRIWLSLFLAFAAAVGTFQFTRWLADSDELGLAIGFAVFIIAVLTPDRAR